MSTQQFVLPSAPDQKQAALLVKSLTKQAENYKITDEDGFIASWALVERHDQAIAKIGEWFNPFVDGLHKLHKMAIALRAQFLDPIVASKKALLGERGRYRTEQERQKRIEADKQAEILRKAQAKELTQEAKKLEKAGETEAATVLREQAATLPPPVVAIAPAVQKQEGSVLKTRWIATITNYDLVPIEYKTLDHTKETERRLIDGKVQGVVAKLGNQIKISGVDIRQETSEHSRAVTR